MTDAGELGREDLLCVLRKEVIGKLALLSGPSLSQPALWSAFPFSTNATTSSFLAKECD